MSEEFKPKQETGEKPKDGKEVDLDNLFGEEVFPDYSVGVPKAEAGAASDSQAEEFIKSLNFTGNEMNPLESEVISNAEQLEVSLAEKTLLEQDMTEVDIQAIREAIVALTKEELKNLSPEDKKKLAATKLKLIMYRDQATEVA